MRYLAVRGGMKDEVACSHTRVLSLLNLVATESNVIVHAGAGSTTRLWTDSQAHIDFNKSDATRLFSQSSHGWDGCSQPIDVAATVDKDFIYQW